MKAILTSAAFGLALIMMGAPATQAAPLLIPNVVKADPALAVHYRGHRRHYRKWRRYRHHRRYRRHRGYNRRFPHWGYRGYRHRPYYYRRYGYYRQYRHYGWNRFGW